MILALYMMNCTPTILGFLLGASTVTLALQTGRIGSPRANHRTLTGARQSRPLPLSILRYSKEDSSSNEPGKMPSPIIEYNDLYELDPDGLLPCPRPDIDALEVVQTCMNAMICNDQPKTNAGLEVCFNFSSDRCRAALGGSLEAFVEYAANPTFGAMVEAQEFSVASVGPIIEGTNTRGSLQTVLVDVVPAAGRGRRFLWTLEKERRPPRQGCWLVHECMFVENAFALTE